jgi:hypothetical protein
MKIPTWLFCLIAVIIGVILIVMGVTTKNRCFFFFAGAFILGGIVALLVRAPATIGPGVATAYVSGVAWAVIFVLFVVAGILCAVL